MVRVVLIWMLLFIGANAAANSTPNVWMRTGNAYGIDPRLLYAISKVESNVNPLLVSVNFKKLTKLQLSGLYFMLEHRNVPYKTMTKVISIENENILQAKMVIDFLDNNNYPSFDIGLMQVNNIHKDVLKGMKISLNELLKEETNLNIAAGILWECYKKHGTNDKAINAYNGRLTGNPYYAKVSAELHKLLLPHENNSKRLFYRIL